MKPNFAQRAKDIETTYGKGSGTSIKMLKQLKTEQDKYEQSGQSKLLSNSEAELVAKSPTSAELSEKWGNIDLPYNKRKILRETWERENMPPMFAQGGQVEKPVTLGNEGQIGREIEKEHKPTYDFLQAMVRRTGSLPPAKELYAHIAKDHMMDSQKNPNLQDPSYYSGLIHRGLSDEKSNYAALGGPIGSMSPLVAPEDAVKAATIMASGGELRELYDSMNTYNSKAVGGALPIWRNNGSGANILADGDPLNIYSFLKNKAWENPNKNTIPLIRQDQVVTPTVPTVPASRVKKSSTPVKEAPKLEGIPRATQFELDTNTGILGTYERLMPGINKGLDLEKSSFAPTVLENMQKEDTGGFDYNNLLRMAPVLSNLIPGRKPTPIANDISLPTINAQKMSPDYLSTAPILESLAAQGRTASGELAGSSGGSASAMRSGQLGMYRNLNRAAGEAVSGVNEKNLGIKNAATQFNLQGVDKANQFNAEMMAKQEMARKEMDLTNKELMQGYPQQEMARRSAAMTQLGQIGKENKQMEVIEKVYGYDIDGNKITDAKDISKVVSKTPIAKKSKSSNKSKKQSDLPVVKSNKTSDPDIASQRQNAYNYNPYSNILQ